MYGTQSVLWAGFSLCYVQASVCVMYSHRSVLCAVLSLFYVSYLVIRKEPDKNDHQVTDNLLILMLSYKLPGSSK